MSTVKKVVAPIVDAGKEVIRPVRNIVPSYPDPFEWLKEKAKAAAEKGKELIITTTIEKGKELVQPVKDVYKQAKSYADSLPPSLKDKIYAVGRDVAIHTIPPAAEFIYAYGYVPVVSFAQDHPVFAEKTTQTVNSVLDTFFKPILNQIVDTNPSTMNWMDLGLTWLFELGDKEEITFGVDSILTKDIQRHDVVQTLKNAAIEKIVDGRLQEVVEECIATDTPIPENQYPVCMPNKYGVAKFVQSLGTAVLSGDLSYEYLGSYVVNINVEPLGNGHYKFHYYVNNPSTWESATRFRKDNNGDGVNEGIIPDTSPRKEGIKLGGKLDQTFEWSEEIYMAHWEVVVIMHLHKHISFFG